LVLVSVQNPVRTGPYDEPEPDIALLKPRADDYGITKATPPDILLLVEVADKTLRTDLGRKARIYATADVAEYWVVDLNTRTLYAHRTPTGGAFQSRVVLVPGAEVSAAFAPTVSFTVSEILG
jgi:Uma2 family endonuclease